MAGLAIGFTLVLIHLVAISIKVSFVNLARNFELEILPEGIKKVIFFF